eukprot:TRINITY_DN46111_c0_g1_i1.p1 TRINITY_DN46111_c0_g1~~TRINITY_DN46111_c0_g1_i1.p1  ORF type:complete len:354 (-),score=57.42 TRINITY_DN46111_c0_g1_i1:37-1065(-)
MPVGAGRRPLPRGEPPARAAEDSPSTAQQVAILARQQREGSVGALLRHEESSGNNARGQPASAGRPRPPRPPSAGACTPSACPSSAPRSSPSRGGVAQGRPIVGAFRQARSPSPVERRGYHAEGQRGLLADRRGPSAERRGPSSERRASSAERRAPSVDRRKDVDVPVARQRPASVGSARKGGPPQPSARAGPTASPTSNGGSGGGSDSRRDSPAPKSGRQRAVSAEPSFAKDGQNVPRYLERVRNEVNQEHRVVAEAIARRNGITADGAPPGHRMLGEEERLELVRNLEARKSELGQRHRQLPLKIETVGQRQRAEELEREIKDVEKHLEMISKPKVYVKI